MKQKSILRYIFLAATILISCVKKDVVENAGLIGKWRLTEVYDGYGNGGNYTWKNVPKENTHLLVFTTDGKYERNENAGGAFQKCSGTFQLLADNKLEVNSSCQTITEHMKISELSPHILIIDRSGIEGVVRYKYVSEK
jgi:hypothetical protein